MALSNAELLNSITEIEIAIKDLDIDLDNLRGFAVDTHKSLQGFVVSMQKVIKAQDEHNKEIVSCLRTLYNELSGWRWGSDDNQTSVNLKIDLKKKLN